LKQILINLCNNAIKFTHIGSVTLKVHYQLVAVNGTSNKSGNEDLVNRLHFSVIDTGIGMTPEQMSNLFVAFNQADNSITRRYGGTGLGLYISKELALKLGGDITVQSALNQGSTFTLWLEPKKVGELVQERVAADRSPSGALAVDTATPKLVAPRILLAEDNVDNQKLILLYLRRMNAKVTVVQNGQQALAKANDSDYDLILMDVQMPVMDGLEATQAIRKKGVSIPIFALTANTQAEEVQRCFAAGCTGHVAKPVDIEILKSVVLKCY
jgi:CheY-like chemotaxis protein